MACTLSRGITSNLGTTANICMPSQPLGCASSATKRSRWMVCRLWACPTETRRRTAISHRSYTTCVWILTAGVRVLSNKKVEGEGLQFVGVPYQNATQDAHLASV